MSDERIGTLLKLPEMFSGKEVKEIMRWLDERTLSEVKSWKASFGKAESLPSLLRTRLEDAEDILNSVVQSVGYKPDRTVLDGIVKLIDEYVKKHGDFLMNLDDSTKVFQLSTEPVSGEQAKLQPDFKIENQCFRFCSSESVECVCLQTEPVGRYSAETVDKMKDALARANSELEESLTAAHQRIAVMESRASQFESTLKETMRVRDEYKTKLQTAVTALETAKQRFMWLAFNRNDQGIDPAVGERECEEALAEIKEQTK